MPCKRRRLKGAKLRKCVREVKAKGGRYNPYAVCKASVKD